MVVTNMKYAGGVGKVNLVGLFHCPASFLVCGQLVEDGSGERWTLGRLMGISSSTGQLEAGIDIYKKMVGFIKKMDKLDKFTTQNINKD